MQAKWVTVARELWKEGFLSHISAIVGFPVRMLVSADWVKSEPIRVSTNMRSENFAGIVMVGHRVHYIHATDE